MKYALRTILGLIASCSMALVLGIGSAWAMTPPSTHSNGHGLMLAQNDAGDNAKVLAECKDPKACAADWERHYERLEQQEQRAVELEQRGIEKEQEGIEMQQRALEEQQRIEEQEQRWWEERERARSESSP